MLLSNDEFLNRLTLLYQDCRKSRSVTVTLKRFDGRTKPVPSKGAAKVPTSKGGTQKAEHPNEPQCIVRACDGVKKKLSTVVAARDLNKFQRAYTSVLRSNIDGLKKQKKKKTNKSAGDQ